MVSLGFQNCGCKFSKYLKKAEDKSEFLRKIKGKISFSQKAAPKLTKPLVIKENLTNGGKQI